MITVRRLVWNEWNVKHIARHAVVPSEVDEVLVGSPMVRTSYRNRFAITGTTTVGRVLVVVVEPLDETGAYFPITARPASRKERRLYEEYQAGGGSA